ncbi:MAG: SDR family NAD(P)-dependent oxidoreductase [Tagaea sp.]
MTGTEIDLSGRKVAITGGAKGIGAAAASRLAESGARVAVWDVLDAAAPPGGLALRVDAADSASLRAAAARTIAEFGGLDTLVLSAGFAGATAPIRDYPPEEWRRIMAVNLDGVFHAAQACLPALLDSKRGRLVALASIAAKEGNANAAAYSAAKAGVVAFVKALAKEHAKDGLVANCVAPAAIDTDFFKEIPPEHIKLVLGKIPMGRFGRAGEIAAMIAFLCSDECAFSTGAVFDASGGRATW